MLPVNVLPLETSIALRVSWISKMDRLFSRHRSQQSTCTLSFFAPTLQRGLDIPSAIKHQPLSLLLKERVLTYIVRLESFPLLFYSDQAHRASVAQARNTSQPRSHYQRCQKRLTLRGWACEL